MPGAGELPPREGHGNLVATVSMEEKGLNAYPAMGEPCKRKVMLLASVLREKL